MMPGFGTRMAPITVHIRPGQVLSSHETSCSRRCLLESTSFIYTAAFGYSIPVLPFSMLLRSVVDNAGDVDVTDSTAVLTRNDVPLSSPPMKVHGVVEMLICSGLAVFETLQSGMAYTY